MIQLDWDMPTSCQECRFAVDGWCYALRANDGQPSELCYLTRPEWCPLRDAAPRWHRVELEEPTESGWYLVMDVDGDFNVDEWHNTFGWQFVTPSDADRITYWMPIEWMPIEPPQEVQDDTCKRPD